MCYNFYLVFYRLFVIRFTSYFGLRFAFSVFVSAVILFIIPQIFCGLLRKPELVKIPLLGLCSCFAYFHQELCYFYLSIPTSGFGCMYVGWQCPLASHQHYTGNREFPIHSIHTCEFMAHHLLYSLDIYSRVSHSRLVYTMYIVSLG